MFHRATSALRFLVVFVLAAGVLIGCSGRAPDADNGAASDDATGAESTGSAGDSTAGPVGDPAPTDSLVIYTYDAFPEAIETVITDHFSAEGVAPDLERFQDTGELYNEVWLSRSAPKADVVIGLDTTYAGRALSDDLFQPYRPAGAEKLDAKLVVDDRFRLTPFDWGNIVLNYDSEALPDPPRTWDELTDPRLKDSIILMNPATSSPGRNFLLLTIDVFGEDGYLDYWRKLKPNVLTVTSGWSEGYGLYTEGEAPIVLSYETSPAYHIAFEQTDRYRNLILGDVGYAQIEVAGITNGAKNLANARGLMDLMLTPAVQSEIPLNQFMYPVDASIALPESFTQIARAGNSVRLPIDEVDANFERWLADWEDVMR